MEKQNINVTQPYLPPIEEFQEYLQQIWESKWLTNNGQFHKQFEIELAEYLGVPYISLFANGTLALLTALQALDIKGEVITTPYTFVATAHALLWNNITPVFCDIDPITGNIDANRIENLITENTSAIVPVHVYGNPCDTDKIDIVAKKYNLKVVYDAAHAFGVSQNGKSILNNGDLSILSFHATKVFNTFEGGAIVSHTKEMKQRIDDLKNFGFRNEVTVIEAGINGKMNEFQAALGLLQLKYIDKQIERRKSVVEQYRNILQSVKGIRFIEDIKSVKHNYSYFPVFIENNYPLKRDKLYSKLKENGIYARRYFYPLISNMPMYSNLPSSNRELLPVANRLADSVICLPVYPGLEDKEVEFICDLIMN